MMKSSGQAVYDNYVKLYSQTLGELTSCYSYAYRSGSRLVEEDFTKNATSHRIADLEMLYHNSGV